MLKAESPGREALQTVSEPRGGLARLLAAHPTLRALFMTAYAADPTLRDRQGRAYEVVEKPFGPEELVQRVRHFLDRGPEEPDAPVSPS